MNPNFSAGFLAGCSRDLFLQVRDWRAIFRGFTGVFGCGTKVQECPEIMETGTNSTHHTPTLQICWWCLSCESDFIVTFIKFHFLSPVFFQIETWSNLWTFCCFPWFRATSTWIQQVKTENDGYHDDTDDKVRKSMKLMGDVWNFESSSNMRSSTLDVKWDIQ